MNSGSATVQNSNCANIPPFSTEDLKALARIKKITRSGHNAEVKEKDGTLIVYDVSKTKAI